jgi:DNA-binding MarR family transcriptional regulator
MGNKYENIQTLIGLWSEYEQKCNSEDIHAFGRWLSSLPVNPAESTEIKEGSLSEETAGHLGFYKQMDSSRQFLTLLSRSARFIDLYIKKAFEGLDIGSRLEFQFLISIREMENPRKTDVIYFNLVEISTGVETLNRLQKNKLIRDFPDEQDKRIKRLALTPKGEELIALALKKFDSLDNLTRSFGKDDVWKSFIPSLMWFNDFHNEIYHKNRNKSFDEIMQAIGV